VQYVQLIRWQGRIAPPTHVERVARYGLQILEESLVTRALEGVEGGNDLIAGVDHHPLPIEPGNVSADELGRPREVVVAHGQPERTVSAARQPSEPWLGRLPATDAHFREGTREGTAGRI